MIGKNRILVAGVVITMLTTAFAIAPGKVEAKSGPQLEIVDIPRIDTAMYTIRKHPTRDLAIIPTTGYLVTLDLNTKETSNLILPETGSTEIRMDSSWHPSGDFALIVGDGGDITKFYNNGHRETMDSPTTTNLWGVAFHPGGEYALIVGQSNEIWRYDTATETFTQLESPAGFASTFFAVKFSENGNYAVLVGMEGPADPDIGLVVKWDGNTFTKLPNGGTDPNHGLDFKASGNTCLIVGENGQLIDYDAATDSVTHLSSGTTAYLSDVSYKLSGSYALILGTEGGGTKVYKYDNDPLSVYYDNLPAVSNYLAFTSRTICWLSFNDGTLGELSNA